MILTGWQWRWAALKNGFQDSTAYGVEFLLEILGAAIVPVAIQWVLWYAIFSQGGKTEVAGMSYADMLQYTWVSVLFTQIRGGDLDFELAEMIRSGTLSNYLLKPVGVIQFVFLRGSASRFFLAGLCWVIGVIAFLIFGGDPLRMTLAMLMALMGCIIHYQISASLAAMAFVWEESYSVLMVKNMVVSLLSGELIPLNMFPESMQWIWKNTPFYFYVYGPTQFARGAWTYQEFGHQCLIATAWMVAGWLMIRLSWGFGIRGYQSLGG